MGVISNRNACRGKLVLFLFALAVLAGFQPGFAETQDIEQIRRAAEVEDANAQYELGRRYKLGLGVPKDDREAVKWYLKAANQGNAAGQFWLGAMYDHGRGVPKDAVKAYAWMILAAAQRHKSAGTIKGHLRMSMTADQVAEAQKLAAELYKRIESSKSE